MSMGRVNSYPDNRPGFNESNYVGRWRNIDEKMVITFFSKNIEI